MKNNLAIPLDAPRKPNQHLPHIPGERGNWLVGHTIEYLRDPKIFAQRMYETYGPVCRFNVLFQNYVFLLGPDANKFVLQDNDKNFSAKLGWYPILGKIFTSNLLTRDFEEHRFHRRIMQSAFKKSAMQGYADSLNTNAKTEIANWKELQGFKFYPQVKKLTLDLSATVFLGLALGKDTNKINRAFINMVSTMTCLIRLPIPGTTFYRGAKGRDFLKEYFQKIIVEKRKHKTSDIFSRLCHAETEEGDRFSDDDVVGHITGLMMAAHDTVTSTLTTVVYRLAKHKEWQSLLREEALSLSDKISFDDLNKLEKMEWVINESMRLNGPTHSLSRRSIKSCEFQGFTIPENTMTMVSPSLVHHLPEYWSKPELFDPERFSPERQEHRKHPHIWAPFGGGAHICIGMHFAYMTAKIILCHMLRQYELDLHHNYKASYSYLPFPKLSENLPLVLTSRK